MNPYVKDETKAFSQVSLIEMDRLILQDIVACVNHLMSLDHSTPESNSRDRERETVCPSKGHMLTQQGASRIGRVNSPKENWDAVTNRKGAAISYHTKILHSY